ncbi:MAG: sigma-70 family RNA polymerase sigma factor [Blastocatellia bacterium]
MLHNLEFKNFTPGPRLRGLVEELVGRLDRHVPDLHEDTAFLRLFVDENAARRLYHVTIVCDLPRRRRLATQEERHDADEAVRAAFAEIERQLEKHKEMINGSHLSKRPARREELRREKTAVLLAEERERELFSTLVERHLQKPYNFVRREIAYHLAVGDLLPGELTVQGVVNGTLLQAYREFVKNPAGREIKNWLLKLAAEKIEARVRRSKAERARAVHIEEDITETPPAQEVSTLGDEIMDFYQPDEDLKLEDIIPDMTIPTPEQILESRELQRYINRTLATLPRAWRRAFVFHYAEDTPVAEIARMTRHTEAEVERQIEYTREYLRQRLNEAGFESPPYDQSVLTIFGMAANVEVPAIFRSAVIEKYKKLEESGAV